MRGIWRRINRVDPARLSATLLALLLLAGLGAYAFVASTANPTAGALTAAAALVAVAGSGLLYAWRLGAGGLAD